MADGYHTSRDQISDNRSDYTRTYETERRNDYGGDLARTGVDLNAGAGSDGKLDTKVNRDGDGENLNDVGSEQLDAILSDFQSDKWSDLSLAEQKKAMLDLADYVTADTGNENPPEIVFRDDMPDGSYGGYNPNTNVIEININMIDDPAEAADTISHEMWHAYQEQASKDPNNPRAQEYIDGFDNYITPADDFAAYEEQMVEAEARDYAQGYKDRLAALKGR